MQFYTQKAYFHTHKQTIYRLFYYIWSKSPYIVYLKT